MDTVGMEGYREQVPELVSHRFGVADLVAQDRFFDDDVELVVLVVQDAGTFQAGIGCPLAIVGYSAESGDRGQQRRRVGMASGMSPGPRGQARNRAVCSYSGTRDSGDAASR